MAAKILGRYVVIDPEICHGKLTFRGTRIMVWQVLDELAEGTTWDEIVALWEGHVSKEAIAEALSLASVAFREHVEEYLPERTAAWLLWRKPISVGKPILLRRRNQG